jgi:alpha-ketoglutarate-dependent taurine dioxygenase
VLKKIENLLATFDPDTMLTLETGMVLILDNHRYLHARTKVLDPERWLKRMRIKSH